MSSKPSKPSKPIDSHRINVVISTVLFNALKEWADAEKRSPGNLASLLLEEKIRQEIKDGNYPIQKLIELRQLEVSPESTQDSEVKAQKDRLQAFVTAMLEESSIDGYQLGKLAADLGIDTKDLHSLLKKLNGKIKNGH